MDIEDYNARWLGCWSTKDIAGLMGFYGPGIAYYDPQTPGGIHGQEALANYLSALFEATPDITYIPHEVWTTPNGYCGRWFGKIEGPDGVTWMRGFDLVVLEGDQIVLNEVYVHPLPNAPAGISR
jgi:hypothetical protein